MTKNAAVKFGYHCHDLAQNYHDWKVLESVAVIAKFDCRVFCHINSLKDKISNTAATIQPNPFWFWEKYYYINWPQRQAKNCMTCIFISDNFYRGYLKNETL